MKDKRLLSLTTLFVGTMCIAAIIQLLPQSFVTGHFQRYLDSAEEPSYVRVSKEQMQVSSETSGVSQNHYISGFLDPVAHAENQQLITQRQKFNDAVTLMQHQHFKQAVTKWHQFLAEYPNVIEGHVNLGYSLIGQSEWKFAKAAFEHALILKDNQANAYYGLALVAEAEGHLSAAIGFMKTFLHLEHDSNYDLKANAALWDWQEKLKPNHVIISNETVK